MWFWEIHLKFIQSFISFTLTFPFTRVFRFFKNYIQHFVKIIYESIQFVPGLYFLSSNAFLDVSEKWLLDFPRKAPGICNRPSSEGISIASRCWNHVELNSKLKVCTAVTFICHVDFLIPEESSEKCVFNAIPSSLFGDNLREHAPE